MVAFVDMLRVTKQHADKVTQLKTQQNRVQYSDLSVAIIIRVGAMYHNRHCDDRLV